MPQRPDHREEGAIDQRPGHPRPPVAPPPGPGVVRALYQRTSWTTACGETLRLTAMTTAHLLAVAGYLRWYAPVLADQDPTPRGVAPVAVWLVRLPLWQAIEAELRWRGALASGLLAYLRAQGPVPWGKGREPGRGPGAAGAGVHGSRVGRRVP